MAASFVSEFVNSVRELKLEIGVRVRTGFAYFRYVPIQNHSGLMLQESA